MVDRISRIEEKAHKITADTYLLMGAICEHFGVTYEELPEAVRELDNEIAGNGVYIGTVARIIQHAGLD